MTLPPLRYVDIFPVEHEGESCFCIADPEGIVSSQVVVSPAVLLIATQLDGVRTVDDIRDVFREQSGGADIPIDKVLEIVSFLDEQGFLLSERYRTLRENMLHAYRAAPVREAYLAGRSYPDNPSDLRTYLDGLFTRPGAPGQAPNGTATRAELLRGMVVPHIDYHRGGHTYAHGYARLAEGAKPDTVLVFGVAHQTPPVPFILTSKDFDTPLGTVPTDVDAINRLAAACDWDPFQYELTHRTEHSIEFHAVLLRYLYGPDVAMIPVLCGHFDCDGAPSESQSIRRFLDACRDLVAEREGKIHVIASADFSHMGHRFGDDFEIDDAIMTTINERDREDLDQVLQFNADGWYTSLMRDGNARRVCGINCIYSTLHALGTGIGELLHYDSAPDPAGGVVSFASVALR